MEGIDFWCPYCRKGAGLIEVRGHIECSFCGNIIETCCDGGKSE